MTSALRRNNWESFFNDSFFQDVFNVFNNKVSHPYDIFETEEEVVVEIPLAGYKKENFILETDNSILTLLVYSTENENKDNLKYAHKGISRRSLKFSWNLHSSLDTNEITSEFEDGMLKISIKKKKKESSKKTITIK